MGSCIIVVGCRLVVIGSCLVVIGSCLFVNDARLVEIGPCFFLAAVLPWCDWYDMSCCFWVLRCCDG